MVVRWLNFPLSDVKLGTAQEVILSDQVHFVVLLQVAHGYPCVYRLNPNLIGMIGQKNLMLGNSFELERSERAAVGQNLDLLLGELYLILEVVPRHIYFAEVRVLSVNGAYTVYFRDRITVQAIYLYAAGVSEVEYMTLILEPLIIFSFFCCVLRSNYLYFFFLKFTAIANFLCGINLG